MCSERNKAVSTFRGFRRQRKECPFLPQGNQPELVIGTLPTHTQRHKTAISSVRTSSTLSISLQQENQSAYTYRIEQPRTSSHPSSLHHAIHPSPYTDPHLRHPPPYPKPHHHRRRRTIHKFRLQRYNRRSRLRAHMERRRYRNTPFPSLPPDLHAHNPIFSELHPQYFK